MTDLYFFLVFISFQTKATFRNTKQAFDCAIKGCTRGCIQKWEIKIACE